MSVPPDHNEIDLITRIQAGDESRFVRFTANIRRRRTPVHSACLEATETRPRMRCRNHGCVPFEAWAGSDGSLRFERGW